jgi:hypothetical protein
MNSPSSAVVLEAEVESPDSCCLDAIIKESLHLRSVEEALKHKWIESEKRGHDLGEEAIRHWIQKHWNGYLRDRWIEHLEGKHFWIELSADDFGLLTRRPFQSEYFDAIVAMLKARGENFTILNWAIDNNLPTDEIREILEYLDVNSARIECQLLKQPLR